MDRVISFVTAPTFITFSRRLHARQCFRFTGPRRLLASSITADLLQEEKQVAEKTDEGLALLACPICFKPFQPNGKTSFKKLKCENCNKVYTSNGTYVDLTITAGVKNYEEVMQPSTEMFRNPAISFVYERGYRQGFQIFGYPGPDEELKLANKYMEPAVGGIVVDVSCATGVFTRRLIKSGLYASVIGLDFSENMLEQFQYFVQEDPSMKTLDITLIRADVGRLPFATGSVDAAHAGAAMHCWPSPSNAVAEISRILKPGGVFVATTNAIEVIGPVRRAMRRAFGGPGFWGEGELRELCESCGLVKWSSFRNAAFIMFSAQKPLR